MFIALVFMGTIILVNLLVAMIVSDLEELQMRAKLQANISIARNIVLISSFFK